MALTLDTCLGAVLIPRTMFGFPVGRPGTGLMFPELTKDERRSRVLRMIVFQHRDINGISRL